MSMSSLVLSYSFAGLLDTLARAPRINSFQDLLPLPLPSMTEGTVPCYSVAIANIKEELQITISYPL